MPMGGVGAGQISLAGDGSLRQWQIFNQVNHLAFVPNSFFAIWAAAGNEAPVSRVLQTNVFYDDAFESAASVSDHIIPEEARQLLKRLPSVRDIRYIGEYPIAYLTYIEPNLPLEISLEALSPFIPLDSKDSGLPAILFIFTVRNLSGSPVKTTLVATTQNAVGWDGISPIVGVELPHYGTNRNSLLKLSGLTGIYLSNDSVPSDSPAWGDMTLSTTSEEAASLIAWDNLETFWLLFSKSGNLGKTRHTVASSETRTWNCALAVPIELKPGETREVTYILTWFFPNRMVNWSQRRLGVSDTKSKFWLGNMYNNWFESSFAVAEYVRENMQRLIGETRLFHETFYDSTLPYWLLDCVTSQASVIRSPTCFWTEDGRFYGFEGCRGASTGSSEQICGCCPLNCTHVWNYEQSLAKLFPDLERSMRLTDLETQLSPRGGIPHRTILPLYLPRWYSEDVESEVYAADGHMGTILKTYREYRQSGDSSFLSKSWPGIKKAMDFAFIRWDPDRDGVCDGPQWNTYDLNFYGHNTYVGTLYLAALRAAEEMAKIVGDGELSREYRSIFERGRESLDRELWNGEYYIQRYDATKYKEMQYGDGCLSDQVFGQWWAHILDLGYILPEDHVKKALTSVDRYNFREGFAGFRQQPRIFVSDRDQGLLVCTWPKGGRPDRPMNYCDEVWSGIEYQVAAHMIYEGMVEEGLKIAKAARDRYDGSNRNPWNEVECGDHYARTMSSWSLLEAVAGYKYNAAKRSLGFSPKLRTQDFKAFFITAEGWGTFTNRSVLTKQSVMITLAYGRLELQDFSIAWPESERMRVSSVEAKVNNRAVPINWRQMDGEVQILFRNLLQLNASDDLELTILI